MDMTITIVLLAVAILGLLCYVIGLRECMADLRRYNDYLERSLSNTSHYLHQQLERLKKEKHEQRKKLMTEIHALRTKIHQLRKERNTQSNG